MPRIPVEQHSAEIEDDSVNPGARHGPEVNSCRYEPPEVTWPDPEVEDGADDELRPELPLVPEPALVLELLPAAAFGEVPDAPLALDAPDLTELREVLELA